MNPTAVTMPLDTNRSTDPNITPFTLDPMARRSATARSNTSRVHTAAQIGTRVGASPDFLDNGAE